MNLHYLSLVVLGFLVWFMGYCQGAPARPNFADATNKMKIYCGKYLADALEAVCKGNYQTMRPGNITQLVFSRIRLVFKYLSHTQNCFIDSLTKVS